MISGSVARLEEVDCRMRKLLVALVLSSIAANARGAVTSLRLVLPSGADPVVENIASVFTRQVESRCDAQVIAQGDAPLSVELAIEPGIGAEGYRIADGANGAVRIVGNDDRGLLYGVGKFLHTSAYDGQGFTSGSWRGVSVPTMPVRGAYFATHFQNYYDAAPIEDVKRYVEDLSLWGVNNVQVWFATENFNGIGDPNAQAKLNRLGEVLKAAKDLGLNTSLVGVANEGYANSPVNLRADDSTVGHVGYHTDNGNRIYNLGNELCPSKPGASQLLVNYYQQKFNAFKSRGVNLDTWCIWPYDSGGCTCSNCAVWGVNGFLHIAELEAQAYKSAFPNGKVILSTWYFDRWGIGEWSGLAAKFNANKPGWVDYIMADNFEEYPQYPLDHGVPGGFPLLNFPEISMYGQDPWGGYGANPIPGRIQQRWDETRSALSGGFPYSEGIYEDLNQVICTALYWNPNSTSLDAVKEYAAFEFSPKVVDNVAAAVNIFEQNHQRNQIDESAVTAYQLMQQADAQLTPQARSSWRWRLLSIRATIDQELYRNKFGEGRDSVFQQVYNELIQISHAENAASVLKPQLIKAVSSKNLSFETPVIADNDPLGYTTTVDPWLPWIPNWTAIFRPDRYYALTGKGFIKPADGVNVGYLNGTSENRPYMYEIMNAKYEAGKTYTLQMAAAQFDKPLVPGEELTMQLGYWTGDPDGSAGPTVVAERVIHYNELSDAFKDFSISTGALADDALGKSIVVYIARGEHSTHTTCWYVDNVRFSVVPEPGTLALLASGLIGLLCYAWRKRTQHQARWGDS
jgi:hypothetical protein